jgi:hypothetical protein
MFLLHPPLLKNEYPFFSVIFSYRQRGSNFYYRKSDPYQGSRCILISGGIDDLYYHEAIFVTDKKKDFAQQASH